MVESPKIAMVGILKTNTLHEQNSGSLLQKSKLLFHAYM